MATTSFASGANVTTLDRCFVWVQSWSVSAQNVTRRRKWTDSS